MAPIGRGAGDHKRPIAPERFADDRTPPPGPRSDRRQRNRLRRPRSPPAGISVVRSPTPLPFPAVSAGGFR